MKTTKTNYQITSSDTLYCCNILRYCNESPNIKMDASHLDPTTALPHRVSISTADDLPTGVTYSYDPVTKNLTYYVEDGLADVGNFKQLIKF